MSSRNFPTESVQTVLLLATSLSMAACGGAPEIKHTGSVTACVKNINDLTQTALRGHREEVGYEKVCTENAKSDTCLTGKAFVGEPIVHYLVIQPKADKACDGVDANDPRIKQAAAEHNTAYATWKNAPGNRSIRTPQECASAIDTMKIAAEKLHDTQRALIRERVNICRAGNNEECNAIRREESRVIDNFKNTDVVQALAQCNVLDQKNPVITTAADAYIKMNAAWKAEEAVLEAGK